MKFSDLKKSILAQFEVAGGNRIVPFIEGKPGGGKSACAREIVNELKKNITSPMSKSWNSIPRFATRLMS